MFHFVFNLFCYFAKIQKISNRNIFHRIYFLGNSIFFDLAKKKPLVESK